MPRILVVDGDAAALSAVSASLLEQGHDVRTATHPERALDLVEAGWTPDVAVLEVSTPDMTGFELAAVLHELPATNRLPVVFMSDAIRTPGSFVHNGVAAHYVTKRAISTDLPAVLRLLDPAAARPGMLSSLS